MGKRDESQVNEMYNQPAQPDHSRNKQKCLLIQMLGRLMKLGCRTHAMLPAGLLAFQKADVGAVTEQDRVPVYIDAQDSR